MDQVEFNALVKEYSVDCCVSSFLKQDHPALIKILAEGPIVIPWALQRLKDSVGRDSGDAYDNTNDPWLNCYIISILSNCECTKAFPQKYAGRLDKLHAHILRWGAAQRVITGSK